MEFWEFLLQKEGDRSWLPLESPNVEILEGRYRVVARSSRINTLIEIRVIHDAIAEIPPKRRIQKRTGRTNRDGLIVVIPFTRLHPGLWELRCTSDLMADMMGESWQYSVHLQVVSNDMVATDDWDPDWDGSEAHPFAESTAADDAILHPVTTAQTAQRGTAPSAAEATSTNSADETLEDVVGAGTPDLSGTETSIASLEESLSEALGAAAQAAAQEPRLSEPTSNDTLELLHPGLQHPDPAAIADADGDVVPSTESMTGAELEEPEPDYSAGEENSRPELPPILEHSSDEAPTPASIYDMARQISEQIIDSVFKEFNQTLDDAVESILQEFQPPTPPNSPATVDTEAEAQPVTEPEEMAEPQAIAEDVAAPPTTSPSLEDLKIPTAEALTAEVQLAPEVDIARLASSVQLVLNQTTIVSRRGRRFELAGRIEPTEADRLVLPSGYLLVQLRDPKTGQVLTESQYPLSEPVAPLIFSYDLSIPIDDQTHLFLGELSLMVTPNSNTAPQPVVSQSFTVTADVEDLLDAIATGSAAADLQPPLDFLPSKDHTPTPHLNLDLLELLNAPRSIVEFQQSSPSNDPLPPQLYSPKSTGDRPRSLQLPFSDESPTPFWSVPSAETEQASTPVPESAERPPSPPDTPTSEPSSDVTTDDDAILDGLLEDDAPVNSEMTTEQPDDRPSEGSDQVYPADLSTLDTDLDTEPLQHSEPAEAAPLSPEAVAFQSLNLQDRFWSRLNALASDAELSQLLQASPPEAPHINELELGPDAELVVHEIVVEDEDEQIRRSVSLQRSLAPSAAPLDATVSPILPEDEPVPSPDLAIPEGELVSGQTLHISVRLPNLRPRIYVKLWLRDRQTRLLLDGPHWLMSFLPNGLGDVEARTQVTVPLGCLELQVEAIAIEMATQRESHKVVVDRMVVPPDLPVFSLDELDV